MTRAVPKEMLPVADRPLIQYAVEEAVAAGATDLVFVTDRPNPLLERHFGAVPALAGRIETNAAGERLDAARALLPGGVRLVFARQEKPLGLGHAVWCAREAVGSDPFAVMLPDDLMAPGCLRELIDAFHANRARGVVAVEEVPPTDTARYGIVDVWRGHGGRCAGSARSSRSRPGGGALEPGSGRTVRARPLDHGPSRSHHARSGAARSRSPTRSRSWLAPVRCMRAASGRAPRLRQPARAGCARRSPSRSRKSGRGAIFAATSGRSSLPSPEGRKRGSIRPVGGGRGRGPRCGRIPG